MNNISFINILYKLAKNQFDIIKIQVTSIIIYLNIFVKDLANILRYFHLDYIKILLFFYLLYVKFLIHLLLTLRNIIIINRSLLI